MSEKEFRLFFCFDRRALLSADAVFVNFAQEVTLAATGQSIMALRVIPEAGLW